MTPTDVDYLSEICVRKMRVISYRDKSMTYKSKLWYYDFVNVLYYAKLICDKMS